MHKLAKILTKNMQKVAKTLTIFKIYANNTIKGD